MKDWQVRSLIFNKVFQDVDLGDQLRNFKIVEEFEPEKIVQRALEYPLLQTEEFYYPGKVYAVAVTFAKLLEIHFDEDFYEALDDPKLFYTQASYFKTYSESKSIYDAIIKDFPWAAMEDKSLSSENYKKTMEYFYKEFLLHEETKIFLPQT